MTNTCFICHINIAISMIERLKGHVETYSQTGLVYSG